MKATIEFFGQLTDITNTGSFQIDDVCDTAAILQKLFEKFPGLKSAKFITALNNQVIHENTQLTIESKIALMPPYSGG